VYNTSTIPITISCTWLH